MPGAPWGFVVYRTVYGKQSDEAWARMLDEIRKSVAHALALENCKEPEKLVESFELTVMSDAKRFEGADSHTIRQAFREWVADDLPPRLSDLDYFGGVDNVRKMFLGPHIHDRYPPVTPRWNFCLFVDETCLRSLDCSKSHGAAVKIVNLHFDDGRCENIAEGWEDGETDDPCEEAGWMYTFVSEYVEWYDRLVYDDWYDPWYRRPEKTDNPWGAGVESDIMREIESRAIADSNSAA